MTKLLAGVYIGVMLMSCGGATDGNANTDTTTMPVDTNINNPNVNHMNRADGTYVDTLSNIDTIP